MPIAKRDNDERDDRQQPQIFKNVENIIYRMKNIYSFGYTIYKS